MNKLNHQNNAVGRSYLRLDPLANRSEGKSKAKKKSRRSSISFVMTETHILSIPDLIAKKRDGLELSSEEIQQFIEGLSDGQVQDCQIGSMLMAIYLRGKIFKGEG